MWRGLATHRKFRMEEGTSVTGFLAVINPLTSGKKSQWGVVRSRLVPLLLRAEGLTLSIRSSESVSSMDGPTSWQPAGRRCGSRTMLHSTGSGRDQVGKLDRGHTYAPKKSRRYAPGFHQKQGKRPKIFRRYAPEPYKSCKKAQNVPALRAGRPTTGFPHTY